jgi:nitronate monooxygenase
VPAPESGAPSQHKKSLLDPAGKPTAITSVFSGRPARAIRNRLVEQAERGAGPFLPFPAQLKLTMPLRVQSGKAGTPEYLAMWAGQAYPLASEQGAAELVARWMKEAEEALAALRS